MPPNNSFVKLFLTWYNPAVHFSELQAGDVNLIQRKTQDPTYWSEEFTVSPQDLQYLSTLLVEDELPRSTEELSKELVLHKSQQEKAVIDRALAKGIPYQPKKSYDVGEWVVFPVLDYQVGEVIDVRPGYNPEHNSFRVIRVAFEEGEEREFASELESDHPLNRDRSTAASEDLHSPVELASIYGPQIAEQVEDRLESELNFIRLAGKWFRRDLLVEVHEGHLNLAEAVLDIAEGGPLPTEALLGDVELPEEISPQLRIFSLNYALQADERFDEVGPTGEVLWFLHRMKPENVLSTPEHIQYDPRPYEPSLLTSEMHSLEQSLDDEWSDIETPDELSEPVEFVLTYPHWRSGTLPLSSRLAPIFPSGNTEHVRFTFVDGNSGDEMPGWVVQEGRYVYGLKEWYEEYDIPVGAYLEISLGRNPNSVNVQPRNLRSRQEWVRVAFPVDGKLTFEMHKVNISAEYDELMVMATADLAEMDKVWRRTEKKDLSLTQLVEEIFPELVKLSPQGAVHAATLYSAVNAAVRTPPGPLLEVLVTSDMYAPVGDNYWVLHTKSGV